VKSVVKSLKAQFPGSGMLIDTKTTRQMMADFKALRRCAKGTVPHFRRAYLCAAAIWRLLLCLVLYGTC
jgi:hypothetical protein